MVSIPATSAAPQSCIDRTSSLRRISSAREAPASPAADSLADAEWNDVMVKTYQRMDSIVGRVREKLPPGSTLLVCSDHGFNTWHIR